MSKNIENGKREKSVVMKVLIGLKDYLTDWKNLLGHALLGVGLLVIAIWAPVPVWSKLVFFAVLVTFNVWRMSNKKKKQEDTTETVDTPQDIIAEGAE